MHAMGKRRSNLNSLNYGEVVQRQSYFQKPRKLFFFLQASLNVLFAKINYCHYW